jgi:hypothetical protein
MVAYFIIEKKAPPSSKQLLEMSFNWLDGLAGWHLSQSPSPPSESNNEMVPAVIKKLLKICINE